MTERLDRILAHAGFGSRKDVARLVRSGRVSVGLGVSRDPGCGVAWGVPVAVDGAEVVRRRAWHVLTHKPRGIVTSTRDPRDPCVIDLLPRDLARPDFAPVGRLDKDTTGLLLLTTDGELAHRLTHPRHKVTKRYLATLRDPATADDIRAFAAGEITLDGERVLPALLDIGPNPREVGVTLAEGRYHQVRRMFAARGNWVEALARVRFGPLELSESLQSGVYRPLTPSECDALYGAVGLVDPDRPAS